MSLLKNWMHKEIEFPTKNPNNEVKMKTVGGNATFVPYPEDVVTPPPSRNKGRHVIHFGGKYKSFLLVPEIPAKK